MDYLLFVMLLSWIFFLLGAWMHHQIHNINLGMRFAFRKVSVMGFVPLFVGLSIIITFVSGWFLVKHAEQEKRNEFAKLVGGLAPTFAFGLQKLGHSDIGLFTKPEDPILRVASESIRNWLMYNSQFTDLYTMRKSNDGTIYFVVDPETDTNHDGEIKGITEERRFIGEEYDYSWPEMEMAFHGVTAIQPNPTYDKYGYTISVFSPIYDDKGNVEAVLGLDSDGREWEKQIQISRLSVMGFLLVPFGLINMIYILIFRFRMEKILLGSHQKRLEQSEERFRKLSEVTFEGIIIHRDGIALEINEAFSRLLGYTREEIIGKEVFQLATVEDRDVIKQAILSNSESVYEAIGLRKDNTTFDAELYAKIIEYEGGPARVSAIRDITARKQAEKQIHFMAYHDDLTGLANRKLFLEKLAQTIQSSKDQTSKFAVMFLDLDRFKVINDIFGHSSGDQLLKIVASRLVYTLPDDATIARLGGDEFTLMLLNIQNEEHAENTAKQILDVIGQPFEIAGRELAISASIGISTYPEGGYDVETLVKNADTAMYRAKDTGRNNYQFYTTAMDAQAFERLAMEQDLRKAIERNELVLHYQPQVNIQTGQIVGVEALLRWTHPVHGMVSPAKFIPLAEDTQLIIPIGEWVLRTACRQNKQWQEAGYPPKRVAVNLSANQFQQTNLVEVVANVLEETQLEPKYLELEITESIAMQNVEHVINTLQQLTQLGIEISMDDFGTGYSSLNYLKHFPIHRLKIDQSFVHDINFDPLDAAIATSIIAMAHSLGLNVIAEGVETEEQLSFLQEKNCDEMQGYYFSRPLPVEALEELLKQGRTLHDIAAKA
ncbi:putative bifunctional diguanylate cyclase/phosphodiesterase [Brevibacillus sp. SYSU BS000544]|uniref:putative bifunctional diguanylate cyclase/phosphodiesterase n=1 Tax=Brevibacillus sp. SYSU BS000544 TaxID=3416443 RepID=UPI003CE5036C